MDNVIFIYSIAKTITMKKYRKKLIFSVIVKLLIVFSNYLYFCKNYCKRYGQNDFMSVFIPIFFILIQHRYYLTNDFSFF